ncbi:MAG: tRNA pseudouridine(55) synthase TruB [Treponema sp.]|nr:tRNA pseudouridine(55) synthase TruB [Treponema sp.]
MTGICLFAKQAGFTSFSSLYTIKRALGTKKVGHTGTLDSFADGLLVVLSDSLTRLVSCITDFDKTYEAVIKFGTETDTLEPTGNIVKRTKLPTDVEVFTNLLKFQGEMEQIPPLFSALHIDGQRASDIARSGKNIEMPKRKIKIIDLKVLNVRMSCVDGVESSCSKCDNINCQKFITHMHIRIKVSKGTYIRSLARDIGQACGSSAHLIALRRIEVGPFKLKDAAGVDFLNEFSIDKAIEQELIFSKDKNEVFNKIENKRLEAETEQILQKEVRDKIKDFTPALAKICGFYPIQLKEESEKAFFSGKPLYRDMFDKTAPSAKVSQAVFCKDGYFAGVTQGCKYGYVIPKSVK